MSLFDDLNELENLTHKQPVVKAPFGWPGSKNRSINKLLPHLPYYKGFCDVFGGSGIVSLSRRACKGLEVYNDRYSALTDFYRVIKDEALLHRFLEYCELSICSKEDFIFCKETWKDVRDPVERAFRWYTTIVYSFGCLGRNWGRGTGVASHALAGRIRTKIPKFEMIHQRFKKIQIENLDFEECLRTYDDREMVFYCDPDYLESNSGVYKHGMSLDDHYRLLNTIFEMDGFVALSGYPNDIYDSYDWDDVIEWDAYVSIQSLGCRGNGKDDIYEKRGYSTECLYIKEAVR